MELLQSYFEQLECRHFLLILDCCFSGAFKWATQSRDLTFDIPFKIYQERYDRYILDPAWQAITSSAYDQKALDVLIDTPLGKRADQGARHSPFAESIFEALEGKGDVIPPNGGDGIITATELYLYLRDSVEVRTIDYGEDYRQTPAIFPLPKHDKGEYIFLVPGHMLNLPPTPNQNPYKGLRAYEEEDQELFYGRGEVIAKLRNHIQDKKLTVVTGVSGAGKSSVVKAGIIPKLKKEGYRLLGVIRPTNKPKAVIDQLLKEIEGIEEPGILICDQYEELVTQCEKDEDKHYFIKQLKYLLEEGNTKIIITVRADFEPQFEQLGLEEYWQKGRFVIPPFSAENLREIIVKPALQQVLYFEPQSLINQIVDEVVQSPGALPLLSFTLSELYEMYIASGKEDRALHENDYKKLGGVIGALREKANQLYEQLTEQEQQTMRKVMLRMVSIEGGELAGRRVFAGELTYSEPEETRRVDKVLQNLLNARLLTSGVDSQKEVYYEPAHDALVRAWSRLWGWVKMLGEESILLQRRLSEATKEHSLIKVEDKTNPLLWDTDPRLDQLVSIKASSSNWMNKSEEDFVEASINQRKVRARRQKRNITLVIVGLLGLAIASVWFGLQANKNAGIADTNAKKAEENAKEANRERDKAQKALRDIQIAEGRKLVERARTLDEFEQDSLAVELAIQAIQTDTANNEARRIIKSLMVQNSKQVWASSLSQRIIQIDSTMVSLQSIIDIQL